MRSSVTGAPDTPSSPKAAALSFTRRSAGVDFGDPVTITGSPKAGTWGNGWTVWFLSWRDLMGGSATGQAVKAGPHGSSFVAPGTLHQSHAKSPVETSHPGNANASHG